MASPAIQIGDSVIKIKDFWSLVKDASKDIAYTIEEMEVLGLVLSDIEESIKSTNPDEQTPVDSSRAARCMELCKTAADRLEKAVRDLDIEIMKGKIRGKQKTALGKGTIDRLRERLRNAQTLMALSEITYDG